MKVLRCSLLLLFGLFFLSGICVRAEAPALLPSMQSGAGVQFELWTWGLDEGTRQKLSDLKDGSRIPLATLPEDVQFRFRVPTEHSEINFSAYSADGSQRFGWDSKDVASKPGDPSAAHLYRAQEWSFFPHAGKYCLVVTAKRGGSEVARSVVNIEFIKPPGAEAPDRLRACAASPTEVYLTWRDNASGAETVSIERKAEGEAFKMVAKSSKDANSHLDSGLVTGDQVTYRIKAVDGAGATTYSNEFSATPKTAGNDGSVHGLRGEYFSNADLSGGPAYVWTDPTIDFNWGSKGPSAAMPKEGFSVRWTGFIQAPATGDFTIYLTAKDGARLWIGDNLLIDAWNETAQTEKTVQGYLTKGQQAPIRLEYCNRKGDAMVRLEWSGPTTKRQIVPLTRLASYTTLYADGRGLLGTGLQKPFPKVEQEGGAIEFELWDWVDKNKRKFLTKLTNGAKVPLDSLPQWIQFQAKALVDHDSVSFFATSSDSFFENRWGPQAAEPGQLPSGRLYRLSDLGSPRQVGRYCLAVQAVKGDKIVALSVIHFEIVDTKPVPSRTTYTKNLKDSFGNQVTYSEPVSLTKLNETPKLIDNDYAFEPQHAFNVINWERFPPFHMAPRFFAAYQSRRFTDEDKFGGPLNRGFNSLSTIKTKYESVPIVERAWWHTPDQQVAIINDLFKKDPEKYKDLKGYADLRSAFVSKENAYLLGWKSYESWGAGGWSPYDAGLYGWDEEQMWDGVVDKICREQPDLLPKKFLPLKDKVVAGDKGAWSQIYNAYYADQGDFVGQTYKGAKANAAERGRRLKVWHYGSGAPSGMLFLAAHDGGMSNGAYLYEEQKTLGSWFKDSRGNLSFEDSDYTRYIDYYHHDFYYHTIFPEKQSMYQKDKSGNYALDEKGRRVIRSDEIEENVYGEPAKIGHEDFLVSPMFLHAFIAKGEANLYWFNGGKYPKKSGTQITDKSLVPALRPRNQETWGQTAPYGQRTINPYLAEANPIFTFMMGIEGIFYWDQNLFISPLGSAIKPDEASKQSCGDIEFLVKGMHRISQLNPLFEGNYQYIRPFRHFHTYERDHPIIRGIVNGRYLALAMTNTYLDPGETQEVELWYDAPYEKRNFAIWKDTVTLTARKTQIFQCKLPALPEGEEYDPDKLYLRYVTKDGKYTATYLMTGNYNVEYPFAHAK